MIYFTSDLHLGHYNIIRHCNRPFDNVEEMDEKLIKNWNLCVEPNDTVYIIGDLIFRSPVPPEKYLDQLNGKKHLIIGNHDKGWAKRIDCKNYFESCDYLKVLSDGSHRIVACHYPMMTWEGSSKGTYLVYGHIHGNKNADFWPLLKTMENALNAGVDVNNFRPVTFEELVANNKIFREE